jgi:hypothetical protein
MSTRSKTRKASTSQAPPASPVVAKPDPRPKRKATDPDAEKENVTITTAKTPSKTKSPGTGKAPTKEVNCTCSSGDDGSPMVRCALCYIWCVLSCVILANSLLMATRYHFTCVDLSEPEAEDISAFFAISRSYAFLMTCKVSLSVHRAPSQQAAEPSVSTDSLPQCIVISILSFHDM